MNVLAMAAVSTLVLGLGGCAHRGQDMHQMHEGGMMQGGMMQSGMMQGGRMEGDQSRDCPHTSAADSAGAHDHPEGASADCPPPARPQ